MTINRSRLIRSASFAAFCLAIGACGGGSGTPTSATSANPAPSPSPSPTPAPTPTPTPSFVASEFFSSFKGSSLTGTLACAKDEATYDTEGHLIGLKGLTGAKIDNRIAITLLTGDRFQLDMNGFGGPTYGPEDRAAPISDRFIRFLKPSLPGEFFLFRTGANYGSRTFTTVGVDTSSGLCFFAVGEPGPSGPSSTDEHLGLVDGLGLVSGEFFRLSGYDATMSVDGRARSAHLKLKAMARANPFGAFENATAKEVTTIDAVLPYSANGTFGISSVTSSTGYTGTVTGYFTTPASVAVGGSGAGAVFAFELRHPNGDFVYGVIATEAFRI